MCGRVTVCVPNRLARAAPCARPPSAAPFRESADITNTQGGRAGRYVIGVRAPRTGASRTLCTPTERGPFGCAANALPVPHKGAVPEAAQHPSQTAGAPGAAPSPADSERPEHTTPRPTRTLPISTHQTLPRACAAPPPRACTCRRPAATAATPPAAGRACRRPSRGGRPRGRRRRPRAPPAARARARRGGAGAVYSCSARAGCDSAWW